jgi:hypothetical protein
MLHGSGGWRKRYTVAVRNYCSGLRFPTRARNCADEAPVIAKVRPRTSVIVLKTNERQYGVNLCEVSSV